MCIATRAGRSAPMYRSILVVQAPLVWLVEPDRSIAQLLLELMDGEGCDTSLCESLDNVSHKISVGRGGILVADLVELVFREGTGVQAPLAALARSIPVIVLQDSDARAPCHCT